MPASDFTHALARLLSDQRLRQSFKNDAAAMVAKLGLDGADRAAILALDATDLDRQALALVSKRRAEALRLIPSTLRCLGSSRAAELFEGFAETFWPQSHRRHLEDAVAFGAYLERMGEPFDAAELNRLAFRLHQKRVSIRWIDEQLVGGKHRRAVQVLVRPRKRDHDWLLYFGI
jgi:hypothetical protein